MLIDSHCHLKKFHQRGDLPDILREAHELGVDRMITIGTGKDDWAVNLALAKLYPERISYTVGLHPTSVEDDWEQQLSELPKYLSGDLLPRAIGEIGLDHFHLPKKDLEKAEILKKRQVLAFDQQLQVAREVGLPVVIHSRNAFAESVECIDRSGLPWEKVIFHCFADGTDQIDILHQRGGHASFTGIVTYKNGENVRQAMIAQGLDRLILETDSPYLAPEPHRGKENHPGYTRHIAEGCAKLFNVSLETIATVSTRNTESFFGL
jgi:TatD DNase family protein